MMIIIVNVVIIFLNFKINWNPTTHVSGYQPSDVQLTSLAPGWTLISAHLNLHYALNKMYPPNL